MTDPTVDRVVVNVDTYIWSEPIPGEAKRRQRHSAERGETITVSAAEADRGEALGFLAVPGSAEAAAAGPFELADDDTLAAMSVAAIEEYLEQVPPELHQRELDRVLDAEALRATPRKGIIALGEIPSTPFELADADTLAAMDEPELLAYLGTVPEDQHDDVLDHVLELESLREEPRTAVLALAPDFEGDPADAAGQPGASPGL